jgi:hypothetical protein
MIGHLSNLEARKISIAFAFSLLFLLGVKGNYLGIGSKNEVVAATAIANDKYFQIAVLGDTQYYTAERHNGTMEMFYNQIDWITANAEKEKIAYVVHVGDITDHGDNKPLEWERAKDAMYRLELPRPGLPYGIPYGVAVGNHDLNPNGNPNGTKVGYTKYFGRKHFQGRPYYGGSYNNDDANDSHFDLFEANGEKFIVMYLVFNDPARKEFYDVALEEKVYNWGTTVLANNADRKAIIVSHSMLKPDTSSTSNYVAGDGAKPKPGAFTKQGKRIYEKFKHSPNVFMMLCGHVSGEALKELNFEGRKIKVLLTDYQGRRNPNYTDKDRNGGNGILRLMKFNQDKQILSVRTFIPKPNEIIEENDDDSNFSVPLYK